ncbi:MAG: hypothetical protein HYW52_11270 [Gemmatimonadetes bacterium]|nr:hypothetical protein [Gemmatimonadota bacterium]MBI2616230.1 hypothetical protein [Gemmatimonadota bacterium]MBI3082553.1 hypothetical protein [Gemmatimonadota bacterium]
MPYDWLWIENVVFPLVGMGMGVLFMFGVYRVAMRWIDRRHERLMTERGSGAGAGELQQLRARVEALEDSVGRVPELEERLDFAERLLTQAKHDRLGAGGESGR